MEKPMFWRKKNIFAHCAQLLLLTKSNDDASSICEKSEESRSVSIPYHHHYHEDDYHGRGNNELYKTCQKRWKSIFWLVDLIQLVLIHAIPILFLKKSIDFKSIGPSDEKKFRSIVQPSWHTGHFKVRVQDSSP